MFKRLSIVTSIQKQWHQIKKLIFDPKMKAYETELLGYWTEIIQNYNGICTVGNVTQNY